jgi:hypothetical protein
MDQTVMSQMTPLAMRQRSCLEDGALILKIIPHPEDTALTLKTMPLLHRRRPVRQGHCHQDEVFTSQMMP